MGRTQQYPYYHKDKPWPPAQDRRSFLDRPYQGRARRSVVLLSTTALLFLGAIFYLWPSHRSQKPTSRLHHYTHNTGASPSIPSEWQFDFTEHAKFHGLSDAQCDVAFPHLFDKLHEAVVQREDTSLVTAEEIDIRGAGCLIRVLIYDAELHILHENKNCELDNWQERASGLLHSIHRAISAARPSSIPNAEFVLDIDSDPQRPIDFLRSEDDGPNKTTVFGLTKRADQDNIWLMPDHGYWAWPSARVASHSSARRAMDDMNEEWPWERKKAQLIWRGTNYQNREVLEPLLAAAEGTPWADIKVCDPPANDDEEGSDRYCARHHEFCRYRFPLHTESRAAQPGRLKYLQLCNSAPVLAQPQRWLEHTSHLLRPDGKEQNFIPVKRDWSDLAQQLEHYLAHPEEGEAVAQNSYRAFFERYLTPAATSCYWRRAITAWASVQGYEPQLFDWDDSVKKIKLRGTSFESYAVGYIRDEDKHKGKNEEKQGDAS